MAKNWHRLLEGAIELHAHSSPSIFPRRQTDWALVEDVYQAGMNGIVLKAHEGATHDRATLLQEKYPSLTLAGGLVCNLFTGGISSHAVDMALRMGASVIWMPTLSAAQHQRYFAQHSKTNIFNSEEALDDAYDGLTVTENGIIKDEVKNVLALIARKDAVLATGHLAGEEVMMLVEEAKRQGVKRILIQHADLGIAPLTLEQQKQLATQGCIIEKCYLACGPDFQDLTINDMARSIEAIGADHCALVTDYGQAHNRPVVEALETFIMELLHEKISEADIRQMVVHNPRSLIHG
ncbi:DUF6282 family protein [Natribacillus halophilus]|uniref:Phosphotriesterase-related protein n=1 Tax=Natribacillus halophilus TaxID=549003 RepID=A0A1G8JXZ5_9BACI|nr:DUF6282 family protein [Natribacillus halophilus]SDI35480.1 hypothetical protein SAMN04488123_101430 [Natribacillus halophilus]